MKQIIMIVGLILSSLAPQYWGQVDLQLLKLIQIVATNLLLF